MNLSNKIKQITTAQELDSGLLAQLICETERNRRKIDALYRFLGCEYIEEKKGYSLTKYGCRKKAEPLISDEPF